MFDQEVVDLAYWLGILVAAVVFTAGVRAVCKWLSPYVVGLLVRLGVIE